MGFDLISLLEFVLLKILAIGIAYVVIDVSIYIQWLHFYQDVVFPELLMRVVAAPPRLAFAICGQQRFTVMNVVDYLI